MDNLVDASIKCYLLFFAEISPTSKTSSCNLLFIIIILYKITPTSKTALCIILLHLCFLLKFTLLLHMSLKDLLFI
jgi:hypothetical protein